MKEFARANSSRPTACFGVSRRWARCDFSSLRSSRVHELFHGAVRERGLVERPELPFLEVIAVDDLRLRELELAISTDVLAFLAVVVLEQPLEGLDEGVEVAVAVIAVAAEVSHEGAGVLGGDLGGVAALAPHPPHDLVDLVVRLPDGRVRVAPEALGVFALLVELLEEPVFPFLVVDVGAGVRRCERTPGRLRYHLERVVSTAGFAARRHFAALTRFVSSRCGTETVSSVGILVIAFFTVDH